MNNATVPLLKTETFLGPSPVPKSFDISNIKYSNAEIEDDSDLISTVGFSFDYEATLTLTNLTFENIAFARFSELKVYQGHIVKIGADHVHLAGSGPALFTLVKDRAQAEDLYIRLQQQGMKSYLTDTITAVDWVE